MKKILCYGDSNTWGLIPGTQNRFPQNVRWTGLLQEKLKTKGIQILEEGLCGRTTIFEDSYRENRNGWKSLPSILESHHPIDGAILMLGTNDCKACYKASPNEIAKGLERCIDELLQYIPAENILVVSPLHIGESVWMPQYDPEFDEISVETSKQLHAEYKKAAHRKNVRIIAASDFVKASETDQEHLDEKGHGILADAICQALNSMNIPTFSSIII